MKIAILGTGMVGRALAAKLDALGHEVVMGTRDVAQTLSREESDAYGNPPFKTWHSGHAQIRLASFETAAISWSGSKGLTI